MPNKNLRLTPKISLKERYMLFRQAAGEIPHAPRGYAVFTPINHLLYV